MLTDKAVLFNCPTCAQATKGGLDYITHPPDSRFMPHCCMTFEEFLDHRADYITAYAAETGMDRELDFDIEALEAQLYGEFKDRMATMLLYGEFLEGPMIE